MTATSSSMVEALVTFDVTASGPIRASEAETCRAVTGDGTLVVIRVSDSYDPKQQQTLTSFVSGSVRFPKLLGVEALSDGKVAQCWEHIGGVTGDRIPANEFGAALAMFEQSSCRGVPPRFDPLTRAPRVGDPLPVQVSSNDMVSLMVKARRLWEAYVAHDVPDGWSHGDWDRSNVSLSGPSRDGIVVFDIGQVGWGPVGFDIGHVIAVTNRFNHRADDLGHVIDGYRQAGGRADLELVGEYTVKVAEALIALRAATLASHLPHAGGEAAERIRDLLEGRDRRWLSLHRLTRSPGTSS